KNKKSLTDIRKERKEKASEDTLVLEEQRNDNLQKEVSPLENLNLGNEQVDNVLKSTETENIQETIEEKPQKEEIQRNKEVHKAPKKKAVKREVPVMSEDNMKMLTDSFQKLREQIADKKKQEKEEIKKQKEDLHNKNVQRDEQNKSNLEKLLQEIQVLQSNNSELEKNLEQLNSKLDEANEQITTLHSEEELVELQNQNDELKTQLLEATHKNDESSDKIASLQQEFEKTSQELSNLINQVNAKEQEIDEKEIIITELQEKLGATLSQEEVDDLKIANDDLQKQLEQKTQEIQTLNEELEELKNNVGVCVGQESMFDTAKVSELESRISELQEQLDICNSDLDQISDDNLSLKQTICDRENQIKKLEESLKYQEELVNNENDSEELKLVIAKDRDEYRRLQELYDSQKLNDEKLIAELQEKVDEKVLEISDLNQALEAYKNTIIRKNEEIQRLNDTQHQMSNGINENLLIDKDFEIERLQSEVNSLKQQINDERKLSRELESQKDDYNHRLESRIDYLTEIVKSIQNSGDRSYQLRDNYYDQMNQLRQLREEMNTRFAEQKQEKTVDEIRRLREEFITLNNRLRYPEQNVSTSNNEYETYQYEDQEEGLTVDNVDEEKNVSIDGYTKDDITNPKFIAEYAKLEKQISGLQYDIDEDTRRYEQAVNKNMLAKERRNLMIDQINKELEVLIDRYNSSNGNSIQNKDIYEREQVKAAEKIRFHKEKIRDITDSINEATRNHQEYIGEKQYQINKIIQKQNDLISFYGEKLKQQGILPKSKQKSIELPVEEKNETVNETNYQEEDLEQLRQKIEELKKEHEEKTIQLEELQKESTLQKESIEETLNDEKAILLDEHEDLKREFIEKKNVLMKFKTEYDRCASLEKELRTGDELVGEYYKYSQTIQSLKDDLNMLRQEKNKTIEQLDQYINDPNRRSEVLVLRARRDDLDIREQDLLSKISYSNSRLEASSNDEQVKKYQELVSGMEKINSRMESLKKELTNIKQKIGA
ncbi:MAG: hypothetical protein ACI4U5_05765, partial [Bacilli bacterium]